MNCQQCGAAIVAGAKFCTKCGAVAGGPSPGAPTASRSAPPARKQWFISMGQQNQGPLSTAEIKSMLTQGSLHPEAHVWHEGMSNWQPVRSIPELFMSSSQTVPAPPPAYSQPDRPAAQPARAPAGKSLLGDVPSQGPPVGKLLLILFLLFFCCWPVGLILLWREDSIPQMWKILLTILTLGLFAVSFKYNPALKMLRQ